MELLIMTSEKWKSKYFCGNDWTAPTLLSPLDESRLSRK